MSSHWQVPRLWALGVIREPFSETYRYACYVLLSRIPVPSMATLMKRFLPATGFTYACGHAHRRLVDVLQLGRGRSLLRYRHIEFCAQSGELGSLLKQSPVWLSQWLCSGMTVVQRQSS